MKIDKSLHLNFYDNMEIPMMRDIFKVDVRKNLNGLFDLKDIENLC